MASLVRCLHCLRVLVDLPDDELVAHFSPASSSCPAGPSSADGAGGARAYSTRPRRPNPNEAA